MKLRLIAVAAAALATTGAYAQVTVYGRINLALERQDDGGLKTTRLNNVASRLGFRGTEDLGGGLKAGFTLEHRFSADTGLATDATTYWAGQSEVNLSSSSMGMLRLGRFISEAYFATADYISMHNHDTGRSSDAFYAYLGRNNNKVAYRTPSIGGATLELGMSLKENAAKNTYDFAANWQGGPLHLGLGYEKNDKAKQYAVRGLYVLSPFTLGAYVQRDTNGYAAGNRTTYRLSGMMNMGAGELHVNYGHAGAYSKVSGSSANQYTLGYNYNLSKLTKVYTYYTKVADKGSIYGDSSSVALGIRKNF